jgi:hypothetical protein
VAVPFNPLRWLPPPLERDDLPDEDEPPLDDVPERPLERLFPPLLPLLLPPERDDDPPPLLLLPPPDRLLLPELFFVAMSRSFLCC